MIIIAGYPILLITLGALISFIVPSAALAEKLITFEGTIQGLNCVHYQQKCPEENLDMYIALEHDFVLLLPDGSHFVLPNLDRGIKARYITSARPEIGNNEISKRQKTSISAAATQG